MQNLLMLTCASLCAVAGSARAAGYSPRVGEPHPDFILPGFKIIIVIAAGFLAVIAFSRDVQSMDLRIKFGQQVLLNLHRQIQ